MPLPIFTTSDWLRAAVRAVFCAAIVWLHLELSATTAFSAEPDTDRIEVAIQDHAGFDKPLRTFFSKYCNDCHAGGADEGGFETERLRADLTDPATFARWEQVYDRVRGGEMPPADADQPLPADVDTFAALLSKPLTEVHAASKSTVLRRLNRREYQNTLNDVFGTNLELQSMLPEDARSHEFDTVGEALGLSMVHLQRYMDAAKLVLETAIAKQTAAPEPKTLTAWYKDTREAKQHVGKAWKLLDDGFVVRFAGGGYPTGMLRGSGVNEAGRYRVRVTGYAYQSEEPITFSVGGTSFAAGSDKPIYAFFEARPNQPTTFEFETWIEPRYMLAIEPYGIHDPGRYKRDSIDQYNGPGLAIGEVTVEGPLVDQYPSPGHHLIFDGLDRIEIPPRNPRDRSKPWYVPKFSIEPSDPVAAATTSLRRVAEATLRRPVSDDDLAPYVSLFSQQVDQGESFEDALRTAVTAILCSPRFLYLQEPAGALDDYALASRLSYFLHRTLPDGMLMDAAGAGQLTAAAGLRSQTDRLIRHERFQRFLVDFADSWLDLREMDFTAPDQTLFPEFDPFLRDSMPRETLAFLREMIESNLPIRNLIESDFAMLNSRLAEHYALPPVDGVAIRKVSLPADSIRGGLLSQASLLKVTANGTNTSPVTRGAWVMERIQGVTPSPPPPGIPGVEPDIRGATTLRELLDRHRDSESCRSCHAKIDPPGFALECFNPIGGYRDRYRSLGEGDRVDTEVNGRKVRYRLGPAVDASGEFDGTAFAGFRQFRHTLAGQERMLAKTFVVKLLTFATGRELGFSDRPEINRIVTAAAENHYRARDLLHAAVASKIFLSK
ncbi:DUF1592 domain-containing protein [Rhodopirellula sp. JC639]|uniref:DUF1592 domain-containing protein n=1 Tax=Stieleria mannarensis TaxID=2755585 RepID=UPI0016004CF5